MPGMLTRSKSLRFLRNNRRDVIDQEKGNTMPALKASQTDLDKYHASTANLQLEGNLKAPDVVIRPSTSGGPVERPVMSRRETSPAPSFHSEDHVHSFQSPTSSTTVLYTSDVTKEQGIIGIALGSPTSASHWIPPPHAVDSKTNPGFTDLPVDMLTHPNASSPSLSGPQGPAKPKLSRWKSLFRKAAPPPPPITPQEQAAFYQLSQSVDKSARADSHHDEEVNESKTSLKDEAGRDKLRNVSPPAYKPDIRESRKWSHGEFVAPKSPPQATSTRGRAVTLGNHASDLQERTIQQAPILNITLPDITMERYSIMFGNLLQSGPSRSSLLERRQGNTEKVKPLNELSAKDDPPAESFPLQRRVTSPAVTSSPRLTLFPPTTTSRAPSPLGTPVINRSKGDIKRSKTLPSKSPVRTEFVEGSDRSEKRIDPAKLAPVASPYLKPASTPTSVFGSESEAESVSVVAAPILHGHGQTTTLHLDDREPDWELCAPPPRAAKREALVIPDTPVSTLVRSPSHRQPKVTKMSALCSHPASAPIDVPSPLQRLHSLSTPPHSAIIAKATVGLARSVSLSRAHSPRTVVRVSTIPSEERVLDKLALTPTMVEVKNRKSHRVQLEDA
ncbi:hypothetical protein COCC4DRAFT_153310 [Bipolaris maydis ATCC 48331]|uniref:Uncharacterized protein n=2 Tax=Cochliobolus heterostrophus TaxID=5016 RepID=M2SJE1_COCH5|nr:uncharacterized protein COCC4DRAFT_153310 [Bipolaris maydis ATCC 48331]EMD85440.1 hypothetical protein COCHEDRAFT_15655 [Bipolaris maydis C5]ENH99449.1 hypothetical protein COCC4DRAFT_153310 [Bipolaris maydis ATCC 48331]KAJ6212343.1 hypothetical protein PSV09DRAFT_15655 [Bipolaris maydis]